MSLKAEHLLCRVFMMVLVLMSLLSRCGGDSTRFCVWSRFFSIPYVMDLDWRKIVSLLLLQLLLLSSSSSSSSYWPHKLLPMPTERKKKRLRQGRVSRWGVRKSEIGRGAKWNVPFPALMISRMCITTTKRRWRVEYESDKTLITTEVWISVYLLHHCRKRGGRGS